MAIRGATLALRLIRLMNVMLFGTAWPHKEQLGGGRKAIGRGMRAIGRGMRRPLGPFGII